MRFFNFYFFFFFCVGGVLLLCLSSVVAGLAPLKHGMVNGGKVMYLNMGFWCKAVDLVRYTASCLSRLI